MKFYVPTCNKFAYILGAYAEMFNKYWPDQEVVVLCYDTMNIPELPENFEIISLGRQEDFGIFWTDGLIPFFKSIDDEYFGMGMEDVFLVQPIDKPVLDKMLDMVSSGYAAKAMLHAHLKCTPLDDDLSLIHPNAPYRTSLHPSIWRRDYFLRYLKPGQTAWHFEMHNTKEAMGDGLNLLRPAKRHVFNCMNVFRRGTAVFHYPTAPSPAGDPPLDPADLEMIKRAVLCGTDNLKPTG